jgi:hypothetical protein
MLTLAKNLRRCLKTILYYVDTKYSSETVSRYLLPHVILFIIMFRVAEIDDTYINYIL